VIDLAELYWGEREAKVNIAQELAKMGITMTFIWFAEWLYRRISSPVSSGMSCSVASQFPLDSPYNHLEPVVGVSSLQDVANYMSTLKYHRDPFFKDYYQPVHVTMEKGTGDCEDMAIVAGSLVQSLGITPSFAYLYNPDELEGHTVAYCIYDGYLWIFSNNKTYVLEAERVSSLVDIFDYQCVEVL